MFLLHTYSGFRTNWLIAYCLLQRTVHLKNRLICISKWQIQFLPMGFNFTTPERWTICFLYSSFRPHFHLYLKNERLQCQHDYFWLVTEKTPVTCNEILWYPLCNLRNTFWFVMWPEKDFPLSESTAFINQDKKNQKVTRKELSSYHKYRWFKLAKNKTQTLIQYIMFTWSVLLKHYISY